MQFVQAIQQAIPVICQLLGSRTISDVMEAIEFLVTGHEFEVSSVLVGLRKMLVLVWSKETAVKEAVLGAYRRLYLSPQGGNAR